MLIHVLSIDECVIALHLVDDERIVKAYVKREYLNTEMVMSKTVLTGPDERVIDTFEQLATEMGDVVEVEPYLVKTFVLEEHDYQKYILEKYLNEH